MAAHQAPPSLGFSRQEHWSGLPFPLIVFDTAGEERSRLTVDNLLVKFREASGKKLDNDRMLLT